MTQSFAPTHEFCEVADGDGVVEITPRGNVVHREMRGNERLNFGDFFR